jgi:hypothetical protein
MAIGLMLGLALLLAAWAPQAAPTTLPAVAYQSEFNIERDPAVPELPFPDNPDPTQCGIPIHWGEDDPAWLSGYYEGDLVQPTVYLYDSHLRQNVAGAAPSGTPVRIVLYQSNPALDYYLVETLGVEPEQEGWVPAPFLTFDPPQ